MGFHWPVGWARLSHSPLKPMGFLAAHGAHGLFLFVKYCSKVKTSTGTTSITSSRRVGLGQSTKRVYHNIIISSKETCSYCLSPTSKTAMNNFQIPAPVEPGDFYSSQLEIPLSSPPITSSQSLSTVSHILPLDLRLLASHQYNKINNSSVPANIGSFLEGRFSSFDKLYMYISNMSKM